MRIQYGAGFLFFNPIGGNTPTNATPQIGATLQDVNVEFGSTIKELRGQYQYPDDTAIGDKKITWKTGSGRFDIDIFNNIFAGEAAITTGGTPQSVQEAHNVPASAAYTITVTNSADSPLTDLGVQYAATGQKFTKVASGPTIGQYSYSAGVYTFAAADAGAAVLISYEYTVTTGRILTGMNHFQGYGPQLEMILVMPYQLLTTSPTGGVIPGVPNYLHLYSCKVSKVGMPFKRADYLIADIEGEAYANAAGKVWDLYED